MYKRKIKHDEHRKICEIQQMCKKIYKIIKIL